MKRDQAVKILHEHMKNNNLRRHCYAVEATMRALATRLGGDPETWGIAGLLHDADYEETKENDPKKNHTKVIAQWLEEADARVDVKDAIASHAWNYVDGAPKPVTPMQWALYTCDELTGLIVACALVKGGSLSEVTVETVQKKWGQKSFAAGVDRSQIEMCKEQLGITLSEFIEITLRAMQGVHDDLGL